MKAKLDKQALQDLVLRHVEKIVFALVILCFLVFAYRAVTGDRYPYAPDKLTTAARQAEEKILSTPANKGDLKIADYVQVADRSRNPVVVKPYELATLLDNPVFAEPVLRGKPKVFAVRDLRGAAELGSFTMQGAERGENRGQRWVVITGLVPVAEQAEAYLDAFSGNHLESDVPQYYHYWVERAEVSSAAGDEPQWTRLNVMAALGVQKRWSSVGKEIVPAIYVPADRPERLVFPLGPRVDTPWGEKVAHPPEISLDAAPGTPQAAPAATPATAPAPGSTTKPDLPPGDMPALPSAAAQAAATSAAPADEQAKPKTAGPQFLLFRFFDFEVKPGVQYRYRVKLLLLNPNLGVEPRRLQNAELAKEKTLESDWSEPTAAIVVPRNDRMRVVSVKPATRLDTTATVLIMKWLEDTGAQVSENQIASRGQLLNFYNRPLATGEESGGGGGGLLSGGSGSSRAKPTGKQVNYEVGMLVLDIRGGEKLPGRDTEPGDVLLMDVDGSLVVRSELDPPADTDRMVAPAPVDPETEPAPGGGLLNLNP